MIHIINSLLKQCDGRAHGHLKFAVKSRYSNISFHKGFCALCIVKMLSHIRAPINMELNVSVL